MSNPNVITADEMAAALDSEAPITPAKFVPYKKVLGELTSMQSIIVGDVDMLMELSSLFTAICNASTVTEATVLARLGRRTADSHASQLDEILEVSQEVAESAKQTMPRKRWDDSGCPDDRPDDDDLAREAAAAVPPSDEDGGTTHV